MMKRPLWAKFYDVKAKVKYLLLFGQPHLDDSASPGCFCFCLNLTYSLSRIWMWLWAKRFWSFGRQWLKVLMRDLRRVYTSYVVALLDARSKRYCLGYANHFGAWIPRCFWVSMYWRRGYSCCEYASDTRRRFNVRRENGMALSFVQDMAFIWSRGELLDAMFMNTGAVLEAN